MAAPDDLKRWQELIDRLVRSAAPRGEAFDLCRRLLAAWAPLPERTEAARLLLEGAMADSTTDLVDAQEVMRLLKALGRGDTTLAALLADQRAR